MLRAFETHDAAMTASSPRVWLKPGRDKSLRRHHPWVFSGAVDRVDGAPAPGATVELVSAGGDFLAWAAFSPASQIRARSWTFEPAAKIDAAWFRTQLARAIESRRDLGLLDDDGACRLVFAESDGLPGLIVDRYGRYLVCQFLSAGADAWRGSITDALVELCAPAGVYERSEGTGRHKEGLKSARGMLAGEEPPAAIEIRSASLRFGVDVRGGQKTGAYLDQQRNRERVAAHAAGADVLDAFAYGGGFALACLKAGARSAVLIDSSADALALAERTAAVNGVGERCRFAVADVFDELRALRAAGRQFDLVVLDPPKFVHTAEQIQAGSRGYKDVNLSALQLVRPGGTLATFSCSGHVDALLFQKIVAGAALDARRTAQILERLSQPADHPVATEFPEAEYLKGLILRVY
jgi:23S rRNA (cytosine1962-C5)-methyltransferase